MNKLYTVFLIVFVLSSAFAEVIPVLYKMPIFPGASFDKDATDEKVNSIRESKTATAGEKNAPDIKVYVTDKSTEEIMEFYNNISETKVSEFGKPEITSKTCAESGDFKSDIAYSNSEGLKKNGLLISICNANSNLNQKKGGQGTTITYTYTTCELSDDVFTITQDKKKLLNTEKKTPAYIPAVGGCCE